MRFTNIVQLAGVLISSLIAGVEGHSWLDTLQVVGGTNAVGSGGTPTNLSPGSKLGYIRGYPDVRNDVLLTNRILKSATAAACMASQKTRNQQNPNKPMLSAAPGSLVQAIYTENGHISLPNSPKQKSGTIYWYGTKDPKDDEKLADIRSWTENGEGGDKRGELLGKPSDFDDGFCVEQNGSSISKNRVASGGGGACKSVFKIPEGLKDGDIYTVYWVWDFSEHFGERTDPNSAEEWYTSCMDIKIIAAAPKRRARRRVTRAVYRSD